MRTTICCGAAALMLLAAPAFARDNAVQPNQLTVQAKRPPLQLSDQQRAAIQKAVAAENTQQKTPPNFQPKAGDTLPKTMTLDVMPEHAVAQNPSLQPFGYAKTAKDVLVIDPMNKKIIAVLPRQNPATGKAATPVDWAQGKGRELTGQAPEAPAASQQQPEPAGDAGDKKNGNEQNANEK